MLRPEFVPYDLELLNPDFGSPLTDLIIDLDYLRRKKLEGSTHPKVFFQLKDIFHLLESLGSARIEGNNTTLAEYIDSKVSNEISKSEKIQEILNLEEAMEFIEENVTKCPIDRAFISELHKLVVKGLTSPPSGEGDPTPGRYRSVNLEITQSLHRPPEHILVEGYMDELFRFIKNEESSKYDLIKTAISHHRFVWIHPFRNGNGRTVRLLTYAMLVKQGFNLKIGRIVNPTAIFCSDRDAYNNYLSKADKGNKDDIFNWCEYVLRGLKLEIEKIDRLCNYGYLKDEILLPAIKLIEKEEKISKTEANILIKTVSQQVIQAKDLKDLFRGKASSEISRQIKRMIEKKLLDNEEEGKRRYIINLQNSYLYRAIIHFLGEKGFLPVNDKL
ncbi:MAG: Fic family protein [Chlamydiia bacterium]|nr:Fic family protein [Chlamydiia bacterium]